MVLTINTLGKPSCIKLVIEVKNPCKAKVVVSDPIRKETIYYDRVFDANGIEEMDIKLPQSRNSVELTVLCDMGAENIRIVSYKKRPLLQYPSCYKKALTKEFIGFAQQISARLPYLTEGDYFSKNEKFHIQVLEEIVGHSTPARIHNDFGFIQVSKAKMGRNTVPMNMAILCHEYSHFFENDIQEDEIEADINGLTIYLGLNYPIMESHKSFTEVFAHSDTPQNRERYQYIYEYIDNFDKLRHKTCR